jgi:hypothetical protein
MPLTCLIISGCEFVSYFPEGRNESLDGYRDSLSSGWFFFNLTEGENRTTDLFNTLLQSLNYLYNLPQIKMYFYVLEVICYFFSSFWFNMKTLNNILPIWFNPDLGKVLLLPSFGGLPQWAVVGKFDVSFIYNKIDTLIIFLGHITSLQLLFFVNFYLKLWSPNIFYMCI